MATVRSFVPEGYDWDLGNDPAWGAKEISAALDRAEDYRSSTHPHLTIERRTLESRPRERPGGWLIIGALQVAYGTPLAVHWHPATNRVRVEAPPTTRITGPRGRIPDPPPRHRYKAKVSINNRNEVAVRVWPERGGPVYTQPLVRPPGREWEYWHWAMSLLKMHGAGFELKTDIRTLNGDARRDAITEAMNALARGVMERN